MTHDPDRPEHFAGRKTVQTKDGVSTTYSYDAADRLTGQLVAGATATFAYDGVGNTTLKHHQGGYPQTMSYDAAQQLIAKLEGAGIVTYGFDTNGRMTVVNDNGVRTTMGYDRSNRLQRVTYPDGSADDVMYYDGDGLRRKLIKGASVVTYVWDGADYLGEVR